MTWQAFPNELRMLLLPPWGEPSDGRIPAGNWPILSIPFTGTLEFAEAQASDSNAFELPAAVTITPSTFVGQKPAASAPVASSSCADLIVESFSLSGAAAAPGDSIGSRLSATVRNTGNLAVGDSFYVSFFISEDSSIYSVNRYLSGGPVAVAGVPAGGSVNVTIPFEISIPIDYWPIGSGYLGIITDVLGHFSECDEFNNWAFIPISIEPPPIR